MGVPIQETDKSDKSKMAISLDSTNESTTKPFSLTENEENVILRTKSDDVKNNNHCSGLESLANCTTPNELSKISKITTSELDTNTDDIDLESFRAFLEDEFIPEEFWHLQRDSFIHRSYNEQLQSSKKHTEMDAELTTNRSASAPCGESSTSSSSPNGKRDSFIRHSINSIRRSFSKNGRKSKQLLTKDVQVDKDIVDMEDEISECMVNGSADDIHNNGRKSSADDENLLRPENQNGKKSHSRNNSTSSSASHRSSNSTALGFRSAPTTPMAPLQGQSDNHVQSVVGLSSLSRSPSHNSTKIDSRSTKQLSTSAPVAAPNARTPSPLPPKSGGKADVPEKEKKRKELSSSRQKKFHRHFQQVASDERVINYFSCALVSDILLQGHLYITENYFAFYSNVFGFVTKLLIPIVSVVKISKEKTAKIIPNAVGVATADERHVFGSFMSREAAYRLMLSIWRPVAPVEPEVEVTPKTQPDVEISECSIEDDSSSAISGNESPPRVQESTTSDASHSLRHRSVTGFIDDGGGITKLTDVNLKDIPMGKLIETMTSTTQSRSTSPLPKFVPTSRFAQLYLSTNIHVLYFGVVLAVLLALFSGFLFFRIMDAQSKANSLSYNPLDFKWDPSSKDIDVYAELLKWQKEMQSKSVDEAQIILNSNLEQIARVRKSLETLSILIHDKNAPSLTDRTSENYVPDKDSPLDVSTFARSKT